jgi:hypothetical protein
MMKFPHSKQKFEFRFCPARLGMTACLAKYQTENVGELIIPCNILSHVKLILCGGNFQAISPKRCYLGEGCGILDWPGALKGAIPEKEIVIFKL